MANSERSYLTSYARQVPPDVLRGHRIMGATQIALGGLTIYTAAYAFLVSDQSVARRTFSGFWSGPFFVLAGITGLLAGRGRWKTHGFIFSCLLLSLLATGMSIAAITVNTIFYLNIRASNTWTYAEILWYIIYSFEITSALFQFLYCCRSCCLPTRPVVRVHSGIRQGVRLSDSIATVESGVAPPPYQEVASAFAANPASRRI